MQYGMSYKKIINDGSLAASTPRDGRLWYGTVVPRGKTICLCWPAWEAREQHVASQYDAACIMTLSLDSSGTDHPDPGPGIAHTWCPAN